jgi:hypothetical protein
MRGSEQNIASSRLTIVASLSSGNQPELRRAHRAIRSSRKARTSAASTLFSIKSPPDAAQDEGERAALALFVLSDQVHQNVTRGTPPGTSTSDGWAGRPPQDRGGAGGFSRDQAPCVPNSG